MKWRCEPKPECMLDDNTGSSQEVKKRHGVQTPTDGGAPSTTSFLRSSWQRNPSDENWHRGNNPELPPRLLQLQQRKILFSVFGFHKDNLTRITWINI